MLLMVQMQLEPVEVSEAGLGIVTLKPKIDKAVKRYGPLFRCGGARTRCPLVGSP